MDILEIRNICSSYHRLLSGQGAFGSHHPSDEGDMTMKGGCLCGAVRIAISTPLDYAEYCHCETCRGATGAPVMAWACVPSDAVEIAGETLRRFDSSPSVARTFCGRCGTSLTFRDRDHAENLYVAVAALEDAESAAPAFHIWRSERLSWIDAMDGLPRYLRFKRDGLLE